MVGVHPPTLLLPFSSGDVRTGNLTTLVLKLEQGISSMSYMAEWPQEWDCTMEVNRGSSSIIPHPLAFFNFIGMETYLLGIFLLKTGEKVHFSTKEKDDQFWSSFFFLPFSLFGLKMAKTCCFWVSTRLEGGQKTRPPPFYFFCLGEGKGESGATGRGGGAKIFFRGRNARQVLSGKEKHININNVRDCPGTGWVAKFCLCVFLGGHSLWGRKNTWTKSPPKSRDNPAKCLFVCLCVCVFLVRVCFFSLPILWKALTMAFRSRRILKRDS